MFLLVKGLALSIGCLLPKGLGLWVQGPSVQGYSLPGVYANLVDKQQTRRSKSHVETRSALGAPVGSMVSWSGA